MRWLEINKYSFKDDHAGIILDPYEFEKEEDDPYYSLSVWNSKIRKVTEFVKYEDPVVLQELQSSYEKNIAKINFETKSVENVSDNSIQPSDSEPSANSSVTITSLNILHLRVSQL